MLGIRAGQNCKPTCANQVAISTSLKRARWSAASQKHSRSSAGGEINERWQENGVWEPDYLEADGMGSQRLRSERPCLEQL